jgi:acetylornithine deacetylase
VASSIRSAVRRDELLAFLSRTVQIKSYGGDERELADFLAERMRDLGLEVTLQEVQPGRFNAIGIWRGRGAGHSLMFNGHMDTNRPGVGWTLDPMSGKVDGRFVYGIGVSNMKAANAAFFHAVSALKRTGFTPAGDVILAYVVGELQGGVGTRHLLRSGLRADYFIVGEPTDLSALTRHAGSFVFRIHTIGRTRHLSKREDAVDALEKMLAVLVRLRSLRFRGAKSARDRSINRINVGTIRAGLSREYHEGWAAQVPDFCTVTASARIAPGQTVKGAAADLRRMLAALRRADRDFEAELELVPGETSSMPPFGVEASAAPVRAVVAAHRAVIGAAPRMGAVAPFKFYNSDAAHLSAAGMRGVVYGPGGKYNTMPDERVDIRDIVHAAQVYALATVTLTRDAGHPGSDRP